MTGDSTPHTSISNENEELKRENEELKRKNEEKIKSFEEELKRKIEEIEELKRGSEKVIQCIKGVNGGICEMKDFLPIDTIPENEKGKLRIVNEEINGCFPIDLDIPFKGNEPCNNQSLGNQIPNGLKKFISNDPRICNLLKFNKMKGSGYPDEKVTININGELTDIQFLWEWKSMYSGDGGGVRIVISKFPNKRIPATFDADKKHYHLWICLKYEKSHNNEEKKTIITITKMDIHAISPDTILNTKFELNTTESQIKGNISDGNILLIN